MRRRNARVAWYNLHLQGGSRRLLFNLAVVRCYMFSTHAYKQIQGDDFRFKRVLTDESYQLTAVNIQNFSIAYDPLGFYGKTQDAV